MWPSSQPNGWALRWSTASAPPPPPYPAPRVPASYTRLAEMLAGQATLLSNTRGREKRRARRAGGEKEIGARRCEVSVSVGGKGWKMHRRVKRTCSGDLRSVSSADFAG